MAEMNRRYALRLSDCLHYSRLLPNAYLSGIVLEVCVTREYGFFERALKFMFINRVRFHGPYFWATSALSDRTVWTVRVLIAMTAKNIHVYALRLQNPRNQLEKSKNECSTRYRGSLL
jgi:hypothetical protein